MFLVGLYDIEFLCSNMPIEVKGVIYDLKLKKIDFETRGMWYKGKSTLVPQMRNAHKERVTK